MKEVKVFLVTVWSELAGAKCFRAAIRPVGAEGTVVFSQAEQMTRYLQEQAEVEAGDAAPELPRERLE